MRYIFERMKSCRRSVRGKGREVTGKTKQKIIIIKKRREERGRNKTKKMKG